jgi:hypothetical protein
MRLYPETYLTTDGLYDRSHRIWAELFLMMSVYPLGYIVGILVN